MGIFSSLFGGDVKLAEATGGLSLDMLLHVRETVLLVVDT